MRTLLRRFRDFMAGIGLGHKGKGAPHQAIDAMFQVLVHTGESVAKGSFNTKGFEWSMIVGIGMDADELVHAVNEDYIDDYLSN